MKVKIIQSHKKQSDSGIWTEYRVGQEIEIDMADYAPNLHEKVEVKVRRSKPYIHEGPGEPESDGPKDKEK